MVAILFIILHKSFPARAVLKIKQYLIFSRGMFRHVMRLDQSPASETFDELLQILIFLWCFYSHFILLFFYIWEAFLIKQLLYSRLLDMR